MSARKSAATTTAATGGAKPDNNNVSSTPTLELDALQGGDEAAAASGAGAGAAADGNAATATEETGAEEATVTAEDAKQTSTATTDKEQDSNNDSEKQEDSTPSPRKTSTEGSSLGLGGATKNVRVTRHSSPLLLSWSPTTTKRDAAAVGTGTGACSDSEELPSGSSTSTTTTTTTTGSQRKSSVERQSGGVGVSLIRGRKSIKEIKEAKEAAAKSTEDLLAKDESSDATEIDGVTAAAMLPEQETKDTNSKSDKDKEKEKEKEKESTPTPAPTTTATPATTPTTTATTCNRVTRKAHAQELALAFNTRVTRNRRQSSTVNTEPQLPARGRRKKPAPPEPKELLKRKRSDDDTELGLKLAKVDVKDEEDDLESNVASDETMLPTNKSTLSIKLELADSEEQVTSATTGLPSPAAAATPTQQSVNRRGRGRPQTKVTPTTTASTSTRATRYSKAGSPGLLAAATPPTEPTPSKRRRVGSANRSLLSAKATSASSSSLAASAHGAGDEDSKDSLASSMDDLLAAAEIKQEKLTLDFEENFDGVSTKPAAVDAAAESIEPAETSEGEPHASTSTSAVASSNGIEPLTVDTADAVAVRAGDGVTDTTQVTVAKDATSTTAMAEGEDESESNEASKAPSLSPEMISEGVSAISVKQFYKKPEFLANNLGIEKDPELGEIVQIATETETMTTTVKAVDTVDTNIVIQVQSSVDVDMETETETIEDADRDAKKDDSYSTGMGELRVDESGDETDQDAPNPSIPNPETTATAEKVTAAKVAKDLSLPSELNGDKTTDDYDDIESDIMEQLAKEGVVDASGNALSASKQEQEQLKTIECDKAKQVNVLVEADEACDSDKEHEQEQEVAEEEEEVTTEKNLSEGEVVGKEMVLTLEVEPFTEEQEAQVNAEVDDDADMQILAEEDSNEYPEENKENVSTAVAADVIAPVAVSHEASIDIELALKVDDSVAAVDEQDHKEEEKPLATVAAEQKMLPKLELELAVSKTEGKIEPKLQLDEELRREKELHLQHLGLLTHQAAELLRQEYIQEAHTRAVHQQHLHQQQQQSGKRTAAKGSGAHTESSGTLKTVIKLNRSSNGGAGVSSGLPTGTVIHGSGAAGTGSGAAGGGPNMASATRKGTAGLAGAGSSAHGVRRQSLKMTFQKGRARGHGAADRAADHHGAHGAEDSYYTIQNEVSNRRDADRLMKQSTNFNSIFFFSERRCDH